MDNTFAGVQEGLASMESRDLCSQPVVMSRAIPTGVGVRTGRRTSSTEFVRLVQKLTRQGQQHAHLLTRVELFDILDSLVAQSLCK